MSKGPLAGIKVVELPNIGPVQFAGMLLSDLGAEVLRVDRATDVATGRTVATADLPAAVVRIPCERLEDKCSWLVVHTFGRRGLIWRGSE